MNSVGPRFVRFYGTAVTLGIVRVKPNRGFHLYWLRRHPEVRKTVQRSYRLIHR